MFIEQRTYTFKAGTVPQFMALYEEEGLAIQKSILGNMVGYFTSEFGTLNQTVHLWQYQSFEDRAARRAALAANEQWQAFFAKVAPMLISQESKILQPTSFSPIK